MKKTIKKIKKQIKNMLNTFHCEVCGKKCNNLDQPKYNIYLEKWFENDAKSATEVKLCSDCAMPVINLIKKAKAFAALRKKEIEIDPSKKDKPYHFDN